MVSIMKEINKEGKMILKFKFFNRTGIYADNKL